jgi:hypothetical protein
MSSDMGESVNLSDIEPNVGENVHSENTTDEDDIDSDDDGELKNKDG